MTENQEIAIGNIANLQFVGAANGNGSAYATFQFKVHDGTAYSSSAGINTMNVSAENDPPTTGNQTLSATEDTVKVFGSGDFTYADVESSSITKIKITTLESAGTLYVDADNDDTYDSGEDVTLNQEIAIGDIANLQFVGAANASGTTLSLIHI